jgi:ribosomal protein L16/L10AE
MDANEKIINTFATRVRQLILQYEDVKKENEKLSSMLADRDNTIKEQEATIGKLQQDYDSLKMVKMLQVTDGDIETARKRINRLIKDVNKCITLMSGEE